MFKATQPTRRYRLRFSLKWLLIATSVLGVSLGTIVRRANQQKTAVRAIEKAAGTVLYDWHQRKSWYGLAMSKAPKPWWLRRWIGPHYFDRVVEVRLDGTQLSGDLSEIAHHFESLTSLDTIQLIELTLDQKSAAAISQCDRLEVIKGTRVYLLAESGQPLSRAKELRTIELRECMVDGEVFDFLATLPKLRRLWLEEIRIRRRLHKEQRHPILRLEGQVRDDTLIALSKAHQLEQLAVLRSEVTDRGLVALAALTELRFLHITTTQATTAPLVDLAALKQLEELFIAGWQVRDEDMRWLADLPALKSLFIRGPGVFENPGQGVQPSRLGPQGLKHLGKLRQLERLEINSDRLDESDLSPLMRLKKLKQLELWTTAITPDSEAAEQLRDAFPAMGGQLKLHGFSKPLPKLSPIRPRPGGRDP